MADLIRTPKSGDQWTQHDLAAFRIRVKDVDAETFFGRLDLPQSSVPAAILAEPSADNNAEHRRFFRYLKAAMQGEKSAVDDFAVVLLRFLGYEGEDCMIRRRKEMGFVMGKEKVDATADLTIVDDTYCYLVVQENGRVDSPDDPEAQLIAKSVAAFHWNALQRRYNATKPPLERQVIPGITLAGTSPIFYLTTVTKHLLNNLGSLQYPIEETIVLRFIPSVPSPQSYATMGISTVENRRIVLRCFEAFKGLLGQGL
ncbi:hypothetical protein ONZ45_g6623 [Pleurotus djamor]|nr:hypothetical protein ONZ45_g6623 [Pleurotus djamor]